MLITTSPLLAHWFDRRLSLAQVGWRSVSKGCGGREVGGARGARGWKWHCGSSAGTVGEKLALQSARVVTVS